MKKIQIREIPDFVMEFVLEELKKIYSGEIIFVAQDGYLMNVEINNRRRIAEWTENLPKITDEPSNKDLQVWTAKAFKLIDNNNK